MTQPVDSTESIGVDVPGVLTIDAAVGPTLDFDPGLRTDRTVTAFVLPASITVHAVLNVIFVDAPSVALGELFGAFPGFHFHANQTGV